MGTDRQTLYLGLIIGLAAGLAIGIVVGLLLESQCTAVCI
jgi:tetrahydromethanopterin S-methyltransferase subunit F